MNRYAILILRIVIALALAGSLVVQAMIVPAIWRDMAGEPAWARVAFPTLIVLGVLSLQVFAVCIWMLLTLVRSGAVFSAASLRYVDVITGAFVTAALVALIAAVLLAPGDAAPGVVGLVGGAGLVGGGLALLMSVMKALLRQAIAREGEAAALRSELSEVV